jgi:phage head maturation protease
VKLNAIQRRAISGARSVNEEARTIDVVWTTGARELRYSYDGPFVEELVVSKAAIDFKRLNSGAPFLNAHNGYNALNVLGVVVPGSVRIENGEGSATIRFDSAENDPDAEKLFRKLANGIVTGISVGYRILKMKRTKEVVDEVPVYQVTKWEPLEISAAPVQVDPGAKVRGAEGQETIIMDDDETTTTGNSPAPAPAATPAPTPPPAEPVRAIQPSAAEIVAAERARVVEVRRLAGLVDMPAADVEALIARGATIDETRNTVIEALATRSRVETGGGPGRVLPGTDLAQTRNTLRSAALLHRATGKGELPEGAREFRGLTIVELAASCLEEAGVKTRGLNKYQIIKLAMSTRTHATADFPLLLADVGNKTLRDGFTEAPQTFDPFVRRTTAPDFKDLKRLAFGAFPGLLPKPEGAPYLGATMTEGREVYKVETFGRSIAFTREAQVNDDLSAFSTILPRMGTAAKRKESDNVYSIFTTNAPMADTVALFHATHANLGAGVIGLTGIGAAFTAIRKQTGLAGEVLDLKPANLLCPAALEGLALQYQTSQFNPSDSSKVNPYANRFSVIVEPRLDATSALVWYMVADKTQIDIIELAYLEGQEGPVLDSEVDFDTDALKMKVRHEFGVKAIDHRGAYKSTGA